MSLADLVPLLLETRMEAPRVREPSHFSRAAWRARNREHLRQYKREWKAKRKAKS